MPHIIDPADLGSLLESDADAALLELELVAAEAELERVAGSIGEQREYHRGGGKVLVLHRFAGSVRAIREELASADLTATEFRLDTDRRSLWRLDAAGTAVTWATGLVSVFYAPADDLAIRQATALALMKQSLAGVPGVLGMTEGNFSIQFANGETWSSARADALVGASRPWGFS